MSPNGSQVPIRAPADNEPKTPTSSGEEDRERDYLEGLPLALVVLGLMLCVFLASLDQLILTTAMPRIVSQFNSLAEISWIPNAYFLTMAGFMIVYGQILNLAPLKWAVISSVIIFELGSLFCAVSFNINFLLFGRGVAGIGGAGIVVGVFTAVAQVAPLKKRPMLIGVVGASFGLSSVIGPLIGGALTDNVSWRWCFYINLPIGGVALAVLFFFMPNQPAPPRSANRQGWKVLLAVDYVGIILALGVSVTFLYPLVEGGNAHPWNSPVIIALFVTSGVLLGLFITWSWYRGTEALLPLRLLKNRTVIGASLANFFLWMNMVIGVVYLTTWYQAIKGHSPTRSGVDLIPYSLLTSAFNAISGVFVSKFGRYRHLLVIIPLIASVASGLEYTINETTTEAKLVGYQILWGFAIGSTLQLPTIAVQAEYQDNLVDTRYATSLATFVGFVGRMVALGIGSALFTNNLAKNIPKYAPDAPFELVLHSVDAIKTLPENQKARVIHAYVLSMRLIFVVGIPAGGLGTLSALLIRNRILTPKALSIADREKGTEKIPEGVAPG